jgi:hypothetical protein
VELGRLLDKTNFELFDFDYQFDDATYKAQLEKNIIDFYYDYEIGMETPDMFKRKFKARWTRIIPFYNKLYNTTLLMYNPLTNYSIKEALEQLSTTTNTQNTDMAFSSTGKNTATGTTTGSQDVTGTKSEDSTTTNNLTSKLDIDEQTSDYPQQPIAGGDYLQGARSGTNTTTNTGDVTHAIDASDSSHVDNSTETNNEINTTDSSTNKGSVTNNGTANTDYSKTIEGITGTTYPELIQKHREALLRINDMVIEEMKKCFILVF